MKRHSPNWNSLRDRLETTERRTIAVVGDFCLDKYLYIDAALDEPSVETGLTAWQVRRKGIFPGAGGTIANNLAALGTDIFCAGIYGDDGEGYELIRALERLGADCRGMIRSEKIVTSTYTKPMREVDGVWTELNRLDIRNTTHAPDELIQMVAARLAEIVPLCDAVIISDQFTRQAGSVLCDDLRNRLAEWAATYPNIFFLSDSRSFCDRYRNTLVKCNASEILDAHRRSRSAETQAEVIVDSTADQKLAEILEAGSWLADRNRMPVLVTRGENGSILFDRDEVLAIPGFSVTGPIDICGAGDATDAGLAFGRSLGLPLPDAATLAAIVSSITIQQIGVTGTATVAQILARIDEVGAQK